ncbi:MAG: amino acid ABC transporter ATP-binding protein [Planctomycetota bacterium]|nr:MAG: amino acid ABC transporter ATP-binding protein [Planctomycetota bacterium]
MPDTVPPPSTSSDQDTAALIQFINVEKSFGPVEVLQDFQLSIQPGERVALIGPSGSGKSTILRLLMTLETPTGGTVLVDNNELWPATAAQGMNRQQRQQQEHLRLRIGMVFQHFNLFPHLSVRSNITLTPKLVLGLSEAQARERAEDLLDQVGLADKAASYPSELSGGQKQRVAIARALAMEPDIMLFDEATSALDPELVGEVIQVIQQLAQRDDMTMLFVTHQMHLIEHIAGRVIMLDGGKIVEDSKPRELLDNPQHPRTKAFLSALELSE